MEKKLFVCNTVYQLFVALWLKENKFKNSHVDIIISDHMNNSKELFNNVKKYADFDKNYWIESKNYSYFLENTRKFENIISDISPKYVLKKFVDLSLVDYRDIYIANVDRFAILLYQALKRETNKIKIHIYEDGLATYSQTFEKTLFYKEDFKTLNIMKRILHQKIYKLNAICDDITDVLVFAVDKIQWKPQNNVSLQEMNKIDYTNQDFKKKCNKIFGLTEDDLYKQKYIFFEQPFEEDIGKVNDLELVKSISEKVGKNNLIVKRHPRNKKNRFIDIGVTTNNNSSVPWEVVLMNMCDLQSKVLITVSSTCVITPWLLFGETTQIYSIYKLIKKISDGKKLNENEQDATYSILTQYSNIIKFVNDISEIK